MGHTDHEKGVRFNLFWSTLEHFESLVHMFQLLQAIKLSLITAGTRAETLSWTKLIGVLWNCGSSEWVQQTAIYLENIMPARMQNRLFTCVVHSKQAARILVTWKVQSKFQSAREYKYVSNFALQKLSN